MKTLKDVKVGETAPSRCTAKARSSAASWIWASPRAVEVYVRKVAPLGDPMELTVRGYELSVRKADAEMIEVGLFQRLES